MKLTDLQPRFYSHGGEGISDASGNPVPERVGMGLIFSCPCGCPSDVAVPFSNPLDGKPSGRECGPAWERTGETFDTMTLAPSILRVHPERYGCKGWHGFVRNGEIITV